MAHIIQTLQAHRDRNNRKWLNAVVEAWKIVIKLGIETGFF